MSEQEIKTDEDWDLIITPRKKWWDLQLRDVWHYRDLIGLFVRRDFVSRLWLGYSFVFMLVVLFIGIVIFKRVEITFIDTV